MNRLDFDSATAGVKGRSRSRRQGYYHGKYDRELLLLSLGAFALLILIS
ncbi:hypothetical protein [Bowmanella dokdonensis]|uniref:Uncharacterized protein n=1 Tax=Bowmanella dokdonensis TaxID=751969 RepID=A0A939DQ07_9ALTE|nr:hypothetical protein [Bowmanella dokdonensis]MBN7826672.1 hypothetical protein [Bowmanella dokdonensis]